jgi:autotransporter-associated beta strand repeat
MFAAAFPLRAIEIIDYTPVENDVFASGFSTPDPIRNTDPAFVGAGYDWTSLGWVSDSNANRVSHLILISPLHTLSAAHNAIVQVGTEARFVNNANDVTTIGLPNVLHNPIGDLSIVLLNEAVRGDAGLTPVRILDVSTRNYVGLDTFMVGSSEAQKDQGSRVATARVTSQGSGAYATINASGSLSGGDGSFVIWESGDSGSPMLIPHKGELTVAGTAWFGFGGASSILPTGSYDPVTPTNARLAETGYALKWAIYDDPTDTTRTAAVWTGAAGAGDLFAAGNWTHPSRVTDSPVVFDASAGGETSLTMNSNGSVRGILFRSSAEGFAIGGSGTLTVGTTGIRNQSSEKQIFNTAMRLSGHQNWEAENGDLEFNGTVATNGHLVVVGGARDTTISGVISGAGALAKDGAGTLTLNGANTYTGETFIHDGTLKAHVNGTLSASSRVVFNTSNPGAVLDIGGSAQTVANLVSDTQYGGTGTVVLNGGLLTTGAGGNAVYAGSFTGTGVVRKVGGSIWTLSGDSRDYAGQFHLQEGRILLASEYAIGAGHQTLVGQGTRVETEYRSFHVAGGLTFTATQNSSSGLVAGYDGNSITHYGPGAAVVYQNRIILDRQGTGDGGILYRFTNWSEAAVLEFAGGVSTSGNTLGFVSMEANTLDATARIEFSGQITDEGGARLRVAAAGVGTLILSNPDGNRYSDGTSAWNSATILVNNKTGSGTGSGEVDFNTGAANITLGGTGRIAPEGNAGLIMGNGSTLSPGDGGAGFLTMDLGMTNGTATFLAGAKFQFDLGGDSDRMIFEGTSAGDVRFHDNVINFQLGDGFVPGTYTLFTFDTVGAYTGTLQIGTGLEAYEGSSLVYDGNSIRLLVVPEPSAVLLCAGGLAVLCGCRRGKKRR